MGDPNKYKEHLSPWIPETDLLRLAALGKLQEELGECTAAAGRCIIQGVDGTEEETGVINRDWLTNEIGDVLAALWRVRRRFDLSVEEIEARTQAKLRHFERWDGLIVKYMQRQL